MKDKYLHYSIDQLINDDDFVNWILSQKKEGEWSKWLTKNPDFESKINEAKSLIELFRFKQESISTTRKSDLWERIESSTQGKVLKLEQKRNRKRYVVISAIAASLAILIMFVIGADSSITEQNGSGLAKSIFLPASSEVELLKGEITYDPEEWKVERRVNLKGEATFDVTKGQTFIVETDQGTVTVLGTKFTVSDDGEEFNVAVEEGRVQVTFQNASQILTAGQSYVVNPVENHLDTENLFTQQETIFDFHNRPLLEPIELIEAYYEVDIATGGLEDQLREEISTKFSSQQSLEEALQSVLWPFKIEYRISDDKIELIEQN